MKKCFTINQMRTRDDFLLYMELLEKGIYQGVELFYPYNQGNAQIKQYTESVYEIMAKFPNVELVLHLPHSVYNGLCKEEHLNAGSKEIMFGGMRFAAQFGVKKLTLHLGGIDKSLDRKSYVPKIVEILKELCDYANKFGQYVMIENMPGDGEYGYSPNELLELFEKVNKENLKFIFDTGHAHVSEYDDVSYLYLLKDYLYHIHYSDNDGSRDAHARIGSGTIDFERHFKVLKEINYKELHCMEIIHPKISDLEDYALDVKKFEE